MAEMQRRQARHVLVRVRDERKARLLQCGRGRGGRRFERVYPRVHGRRRHGLQLLGQQQPDIRHFGLDLQAPPQQRTVGPEKPLKGNTVQ